MAVGITVTFDGADSDVLLSADRTLDTSRVGSHSISRPEETLP